MTGTIPPGMQAVLLDRLPDTLISVDPAGRIDWVSPNVRRLLGYEAAELIGLSAELLYADAAQRRNFLSKITAAHGAAERFEFQARRKDGSLIWAVVYSCAILDQDGRLQGFRGVIRDISETHAMRATLEESEDRFRRLSDVSSEAICIHHQGKIIDFNKSFEELFGYDRAEFLTMWAWDVIDPRDIPLAKEMVRIQHQVPYEVRGLRKDGSVFPMEINSKQSRMGEMAVRVTCIRDLTNQKKVEEKLRLLSQAVEQSPVGMAVVSAADAVVQYVNGAHQTVSGIAPQQCVGHPLAGLFPGKAQAVLAELWQSVASGTDWSGEVQMLHPDGRSHWLEMYASPVVTDGAVSHCLLLSEDISLRKEQERKILHQAMFDPLTDLPNRAQAVDRLGAIIDEARDRGEQAALLFVDLDEFKTINDSLGHEYGDELLILASERLRAAVGGDAMVARFGGDEFLVIVPRIDGPEQVGQTSQAIVTAFSQPFTISRRDLITTASIGVALYPDDGRTQQTLLRNADIAMYQAKLNGRSRFCFFTARMDEDAQARLHMEGLLRKAVGTGQLFLHYQPLVEVASGAMVGVEALLRWDSPELGMVGPDRFIPLAETSGLIVPIGRDVLHQACRQVRRWMDEGRAGLHLCVNVSPRQFQDSGFLDDVRAALAESGLPPSQLELEITEGLLLKERGEVEGLLHALHDLGIKLAIDDFGTGYSSLSYLERYPFDTLKIDRSFMMGMLERGERMVLVETIIAMASGLGLKVIAEGVETAEQLTRLKDMGCDMAQGYLFSRPVLPELMFESFDTHRFLETDQDGDAAKTLH